MPSDAGHRCEYRDFSLLHDNLLLQCFILISCIVYVKSVIFYLNFCICAMPLIIGVRLGICLYDKSMVIDQLHYTRGRHLSYQRGKRNTNPGTRCEILKDVERKRSAKHV